MSVPRVHFGNALRFLRLLETFHPGDQLDLVTSILAHCSRVRK